MENLPLSLRKWVKECLKNEFDTMIENGLDRNKTSHDIAQRIIQSKEMAELVVSINSMLKKHYPSSRANSVAMLESRPQTSISITSELSGDEWGPIQVATTDHFTNIINKISQDKPIHVRLAGYEALARSEITNISSSQSWDVLLKALRDGIIDESQPVFEASLQAYSKMLSGSQAEQEVFTHLMKVFNILYNSKRMHHMLPTFTSGINFKIFMHEKLFRIVHLIIRHLEESLKSNRYSDKVLEEVMEQFVTFLSLDKSGNVNHTQTLTILDIVSILDPKAEWSRKWIHSLTTRKILTAALEKSPIFLQNTMHLVRAGLAETPAIISAYIEDDSPEVNISGDTIKTATYLHCLSLLSLLCSKITGRELLRNIQLDEPFNISDFMLSLLNSLNSLAVSEVPASIYDTSRFALQKLLEPPSVMYDARFHELALDPLLRVAPEAECKIYPHMIDVMTRVLDTEEGSRFIISKLTEFPVHYKERITGIYPGHAVLEYTSDLLLQPLSIMDIEHVIDMFKFIGRLFEFYDVCLIVRHTLTERFFPAIAYLYSKIDKYSVDNEIKTQMLDSSIKTALLKIVSIPLALQLLSNEELVFEELLRGSIEPLKWPWSCNDVVAFVSIATLVPLGSEILRDLAPQFLSKVLTNICKKTEDPNCFYDPWGDGATKEFLHILRLLCLNNSCIMAILDNNNEEHSSSEDDYPRNLCELLQHSLKHDSHYHCLALLALNVLIQNLDANLYLNTQLNFQEVLLDIQENCITQEKNDGALKIAYRIDESSLLRHKVLMNSYYILGNSIDDSDVPEQTILFSKFPPSTRSDTTKLCPETSLQSELEKFLHDTKPGLRDNGWVSQIRKAYKNSSKNPIEHSVLIDLLGQMQKAVSTFELTCHYKWPINNETDPGTLSPEDDHGIESALLYAEQNRLMEVTSTARANLKTFLKEAHIFIKYGQNGKFEGFDWFIATVFIICNGDIDRCRTFVTQIVQFPSIMYIWSTLGKSLSCNNNLPVNIRITFSHLLEGIISNEFPSIKYALKNNCGTDWWIICDGLLSHCFWGSLQWCEIVHLLAICILYPPDYTLYYCTSLLDYCRNLIMEDVTVGKMWPEHMTLSEYHCGNHFQLMDLLSKRYRTTTLSMLMIQETERVTI